MGSPELDAVREHLARLTGRRVSSAELGHGSFLLLDLGAPRRTSTGRLRSEYGIWLYGAAWTIRRGGRVAARSSDRPEKIERWVSRLAGKAVVLADMDPDSLSLWLRFEEEIEVATAEPEVQDIDAWFFYLPDGSVFTAGCGNKLTRESAGPVQQSPREDRQE